MVYSDLLRLTVLLTGAMATALGAVGVIAANGDDDTTTLIVAGAWWVIAAAIGLWMGTPRRAADAMRRTLADARTRTALPVESPGRIAFTRLWPLGLVAILAALQWRNREAVVTGVEDRDGVRFYVEPTSVFEPVRLIRTPGLTRDRMPAGHPPPPPPAEADEPLKPA